MLFKRLSTIVLFLFTATLAGAFATTTLTSINMRNSVINTTTIGATTPSTGNFTTLAASGGITGTLTGTATGLSGISGSPAAGWQQQLNGTIIEGGTTASFSGTLAVTFPHAFPTACLSAVVSTIDLGGGDRISFTQGCTTSGFTANNNGSGAGVSWIAFGY